MMIGVVLIIVVSVMSCFGLKKSAQAIVPYPKNFSSENFRELEQRTVSLIAFDGQIIRKEKSRNNTPASLVDLGNSHELWTVLMYKNELNKAGDSVRLLGYLIDIEAPKPEEDYFNGYDKMVLAMGMIDLSSSKLSFVDGAEKQRNEWASGKVPKGN